MSCRSGVIRSASDWLIGVSRDVRVGFVCDGGVNGGLIVSFADSFGLKKVEQRVFPAIVTSECLARSRW